MQQRVRISTKVMNTYRFAEVVGVRCGICGAVTEKSFATIHHGHVTIQNVPCNKCRKCNEIIYTGDVIKHLEEIIRMTQGKSYNVLEVNYD